MRTLTWSWSHDLFLLTLRQFNSVVSAITSCFMAVVNAIVTVSPIFQNLERRGKMLIPFPGCQGYHQRSSLIHPVKPPKNGLY